MEFERKMMYRLFWIEKDVQSPIEVKEALFETRDDAEKFKKMLETFKPDVDAHILKWSWKVLIEK